MTTWKCDLCGYVHNGTEPPEFCPVCGAAKTHFSPLIIKQQVRSAPNPKAWQCSICDHISQEQKPPDSCPVCGAAAVLFHPHVFKQGKTAPCGIEKLIIIGAGIAGMSAAEEARRHTKDVEITMISKEDTLPYYRLNLTRFLAGEVRESDLTIQQQDWFKTQGIKYLIGEVQRIDRKNRSLTLLNGETLEYDRLIISNGAHPFIPPIPGAHRDNVTVLRTLEHAREMIQKLRPGTRVVCVGGGLLGLETAGALQKRGAEVTVLEGYHWLLPRQLPQKAANLLQGHLHRQAMIIKCGIQVKEFTGDEAVRAVLLEDGTEIPADLVVLATGVRPNSYLARDCGLKVNQGIVVNDQLFTSDEHILAAGDVTEHRGRLYGIWPASYAQGIVAGANSVGGRAEFTGIPMTNRIKVLDVDLFSIGQIQPTDASSRVYEVQDEANYRGLVCHDGQVVGAILYGDMTLLGVMQAAVEAGHRIQELTGLRMSFPELE